MSRFLPTLPVAIALSLSGAGAAVGVTACSSPEATDSGAVAVSTRTRTTAEVLAELHGRPCPSSSAFTCGKLPVPLDHFATGEAITPAHTTNISVEFAVRPASGERRGMYVVVVGGPGSSGVERVDAQTSIDPKISEQFDIVYFDLRSIGGSGDFKCPRATAAKATRGMAAADSAGFVDNARRFADECIREMAVPAADLPFYSTRQAVEDLERFREAMGDDKLYIYGMSYGTQFAQYYAAAHPTHVAGMIVDGVVDVTLTLNGYGASVVARQNEMLTEVLGACAAAPACAKDFGGNPTAAYDALATQLAETPAGFDYPLSSGMTVHRTFTAADLESVSIALLRTSTSRASLLSGLAAARGGNVMPLVEELYSNREVRPATLEPTDATKSDGTYFVITCNDYSLAAEKGTTEPEATARAYVEAATQLGARPRLLRSFFYDLPCAFWPRGENNATRPAALTLDRVPALVIGARGDSVTPYGQGVSVQGRLRDGYLVTHTSGTHVMAGRSECVSSLVKRLVVDGLVPTARETTCEGPFVDGY